MPNIVIPFPVNDYPAPPEGQVSALLSARVAVGVINATKTLAQYPSIVAHADEDSRRLVILLMLEVVARAAADPDTKAIDIMAALYELVPEQDENGAVS
jgi:hypothetical protein